MTRFMSRTTQMVLDILVLSLALWVAFFLRFDGVPPFLMFKRLVFLWPWVVALQFVCLMAFGVPRFSWRFVGLREVTRIGGSLLVAAVVLLIVRLVSGQLITSVSGYLGYVLIPLGIIAMDFVIAFLGVTGIRALRRITSEHRATRSRATSGEAEPILLIGAGEAGLQVAKELRSRPELLLRAVGFLDDDPVKVGTIVHGIPVLGTTGKMAEFAQKFETNQALITIASAHGEDIRRIGRECRNLGIKAKIIPSVHDIVGGHVNLGEIRDLAIEDLLRREPVRLEEDVVSDFIEGQVVMVTGAGGSIGSELCVQICKFSPSSIVLVERAENALFEAHRALLASFPDISLVPCIADITDEERMRSLFQQHKPDSVFHAAAHKHVPMMEENPGEAVKNNVFGTKNLVDISKEFAVEAFVMVSTDKAVNPTSVMGATKRIAETYVQAAARTSKTRFVTVRFGNVLGSAGSVIPIFKKQIAEGGPVTVTHPEMQRYFMTIPEACQLILQAGAMGEGGEIFILDMGEPVLIVDLAKDLIALSGFREGVDIHIEFSGIRPGEKLFEELSTDSENANRTRHPKIFVGRERTGAAAVSNQLVALHAVVEKDSQAIRSQIAAIVPEYSGASSSSSPANEENSEVRKIEQGPRGQRQTPALA